MNRREFLIASAGTAFALGALSSGADASEEAKMTTNAGKKKLKKAVIFSMLPDSLSVPDRFKLAHDVGFDGVEVAPMTDAGEIKTMRDAADKAGVEIQSIIFGGWQSPLSSSDPAVAERGVKDIKAALEGAKGLGVTGLLLVPGIVNGETRYVDCYQRSQKLLKQLIPSAEKAGVPICVENVWNNFLMSPLEFARYIDELKSPWIKAYFDVGNVIAFGWSEDWIRTLGKRIKKIHLKDFKRGPRQWVNLLEGDVNWPEVGKALAEVGYEGYLTAELSGGDEKYLRDLSERMDKIIAMDPRS